MFICNHCPYVRAISDRIARDALDLQKRGIGVIAVMPNDYLRYPDDAPEQMKEHDTSRREERGGGPTMRSAPRLRRSCWRG
jgi:hypothetical protein